MCGFAGFLGSFSGVPTSDWPEVLQRMGTAIAHRGPDDDGIWLDESAGIGLVHRRLSILDLSPAGHQPMMSVSGRYVIAFNGEIYNHLELRKELENRPSSPLRAHEEGGSKEWRGHSDTETLLACIEAWGLEDTLRKSFGMFAFALWDRQERTLHMARDRIGEKPFYYGWMGRTFLFGSELKALRAHPAWRGEVDRDALAAYARHNYVPSPSSIYKGIYKLRPGTYLSLTQASAGKAPAAKTYWSAREIAEAGASAPFAGDEQAALNELERLLKQSVSRQMVADVPLGAFLSGGYDSSMIVALMQSLNPRPVKTFTIGFHEAGYNEANHAKAVAQYLGTEHTELYVTPEEAMAVIPRLPSLYDEPFADSSQIPTFLVSQLTRRHVTVSLSGDAGDELFGGYNRYFWARNLWHKLGWMPAPMRRTLAGGLTALRPSLWDGLFHKLGPLLPSSLHYKTPGDKLHKLAEILASPNPESIYLDLVSHWKHPTQLIPGAVERPTVLTDAGQWADLDDFSQRMMYLDLVSYLPDDILVKVDRAAMGVSLETRIPFLDHHVVEFAWTLPLNMKIRGRQGKWLLRQLLYRHLPRELMDRPKMGFGVPIDMWLRGPLQDWAESYLDESRLRQEGYFDPAPIRTKWAEHLEGRRNWAYYLWDILMFETWLESQAT